MSVQKNDKRRQHYVPKFYLRNFSPNNKSIGLYRFIEGKIIERASIKDSFWKEYFYGEDASVENKLAEYERKWNNIISSVIEREQLPDNEKELVLLRFFILITSARTWKRGNQINKEVTGLIKKLLEMEEPTLFNTSIAEGLSIRMANPSLLFINSAQQILPSMIDLEMDVLINKSAINYITSDNPTVFCNQLFLEKSLTRGYGWGEHGIQFIVPISPKIAICMYDSEVYKMNKNIISSIDTINKLNELFMNNADESIVFLCDPANDKTIDENLKYIKELALKYASSSKLSDECDVVIFSNKQVRGGYDLSDIFEVRKKYSDMSISNHGEEEINQKINFEIEKLVIKLQEMPEDELLKLLESKKGEIIHFYFDDMIRPWVKTYDKYKDIIMIMYDFLS